LSRDALVRTAASPRTPAAPGAVAALALAILAHVGPLGAQKPDSAPPLDTASLATGPFSTMEMLYERTIFGVDVLRLTVRFGPETAGKLRALIPGRERSDALEDSVAALAADTRDALVRSRFVRDVSYGQWLDGIRRNLSTAWERGYLGLDEPGFGALMDELEASYAPLRERGIREGEIVSYRIRGDTVVFRIETRVGRHLVDETTVGESYRRSVLWSYLAPGSDFREGLIASIFRRRGG